MKNRRKTFAAFWRPAPFAFVVPMLLAIAMFLSACSHENESAKTESTSEHKEANKPEYYTCTMHPSVRSQDPNGKCPICSMSLVPVYAHPADNTNNSSASPAIAGEHPHEFVVPV